jgi:hypothetical protein
MHQPAVAAAQPVVARGASGDGADGLSDAWRSSQR